MDGRIELSGKERAERERFDGLYLRGQSPVSLSVERSVCGCDYGGTSWTTRAEADGMAARLALGPGVRLLDLGAGSGWPALYMGKTRGCDVALVDLPFEGLRIAAARAERDGIADRVRVALADAAALPFPDRSFDAVTHSDLLCCLEQKRSVLAACRRAIRRDGRMLFTVISVAPGLTGERYREAAANGPEFIETDTDYPTLLARTGWTVMAREDITDAYAASCRRQIEADEVHEEGLLALIGASELAERMAGWHAKLAAIGDKLLRRELFEAAPSPE